MTSTSSPSTAAAWSAILAMQRRAVARQRVDDQAPSASAIASSAAGHHRIDRADQADRSTITAMHGGSTFHAPVFSTVKTALAVAVIRLARAPGRRSAK